MSLAAWRARLALPIGTLLVLGGMLVSAGPVAAAASECDAIVHNLVTNCGFETGNFTGWTQAGNTGFSGVSNQAAYVHSGTYGGFFGPVGSTGSISQTVATQTGRTYTLRFWLVNFDATPTHTFTATVTNGGSDATALSLVDPSAFPYTAYEYEFVADSTTVTFTFRHDPSFWGLDDVSVVSHSLYFHAGGTFDQYPPTGATPQQADSGVLKYAGGNPWVLVGTWTNASGLFAQGNVRLWLGLKNSDDQGTNFDIKTEVNGGGGGNIATDSCITGITRNPALAKAYVSSAVGSATFYTVSIFARIGTTDANSASAPKCAGHASAVGLRLYYDSASRPSGLFL